MRERKLFRTVSETDEKRGPCVFIVRTHTGRVCRFAFTQHVNVSTVKAKQDSRIETHAGGDLRNSLAITLTFFSHACFETASEHEPKQSTTESKDRALKPLHVCGA